MLNQFEKDTIIPYPNCKILKENIVLLLCIFFAKIVLSHYYKKKMDDVLNANLICMNKLLSCLIKVLTLQSRGHIQTGIAVYYDVTDHSTSK